MTGHQVAVEAVDSGGHGGVGGEHRPGAHGLQCGVEGDAPLAQFPDAFQAEEARVALVGVEHLRFGVPGDAAVRAHRPHSADAQQHLLEQPVLAAAAVEPVGDLALAGGVLLHVGVEQQQRYAADPRLPDVGAQAPPAGQPQLHAGRGAAGPAQQLQRHLVGVQDGVVLLLPAVPRQALPEVAVSVQQPHSDQRDAEVAGGLEVVAGEDAEAAGVVRQHLGDTEFHREVGDAGGQCRAAFLLFLEPAGTGEVVLEVGGSGIEAGEEVAVLGERVEAGGRHLAEQPDGVVAAPAPQVRVDRFEQVLGLRVPRPSEVGGQGSQRSQPLGKMGSYGEPAQCFHGEHTTDRGRFVTAGRRISRARIRAGRGRDHPAHGEAPRRGRVHMIVATLSARGCDDHVVYGGLRPVR